MLCGSSSTIVTLQTTMDELKELTGDIYQLQLTPSYSQDKIIRDDLGILKRDHHRVHPNLLRFYFYSRHIKRGTYRL